MGRASELSRWGGKVSLTQVNARRKNEMTIRCEDEHFHKVFAFLHLTRSTEGLTVQPES